MEKFKTYESTDLESRWFFENECVFGLGNNDYQEGFGYGIYGSSVYCRIEGNGEGYGYDSGNGNRYYPAVLIQYW